MSSIIYRTNPASGYVYAYKSTSFWDPKLKRPRSHQEYLGRVDPETKEILPKGTNGKRNRGPSRKSDPQKDAELESIKKEIVYLREKSKLDNEFVAMLDSALQKHKAAVASFSQKYDEKGGNGG